MKLLSALLLVLALSLPGCGPPPLPAGTPAPVITRALDATVVIGDGEGHSWCSGVLHDGLIITANHCIREGVKLAVLLRTDDKVWIPVDVLGADPEQDIAVLRASTRQMEGGLLLADYDPTYGDPVVVIGHPLGLRWSVVNGIVSHPRRRGMGGLGGEIVWMQLSAPLAGGNSGGPVLNQYAEIVGIISFTAGWPHLAAAVHRESLVRILTSVTTTENE